MKHNKPDVSIIIVNYNAGEYLRKTIDSLTSFKEVVTYEILVIDNNSSDNSIQDISSINGVRIIENAKNVGFAAANNIGFKHAKGKYLLLLNPDIEITQNDTLTQVVQYMDKNTKVGIASCALLNPDKSYQSSGGYFPTLSRVFTWMFFLDDVPLINKLFTSYHPRGDWSKTHEQDWVTGAFFMIRHEVLEDIFKMDTDYFVYVEEVDFCYRAKQAGWKVVYLAHPKVIHYGQVTSGSGFAIVSEYKNLKIFFTKHFPKWQMPIFRVILKAGAVFRAFIIAGSKGHRYFNIYLKAYDQI